MYIWRWWYRAALQEQWSAKEVKLSESYKEILEPRWKCPKIKTHFRVSRKIRAMMYNVACVGQYSSSNQNMSRQSRLLIQTLHENAHKNFFSLNIGCKICWYQMCYTTCSGHFCSRRHIILCDYCCSWERLILAVNPLVLLISCILYLYWACQAYHISSKDWFPFGYIKTSFVGLQMVELCLSLLYCFVNLLKRSSFYFESFFSLGTSERVCLIVGTIDACQNAHEEISKIITEKPDPQPKPNSDGDGKINYQRHTQVPCRSLYLHDISQFLFVCSWDRTAHSYLSLHSVIV